MKKFSRPKVYLISRPSLNIGAIKQFLNDEYGNREAWQESGKDIIESDSSDAELLPEFAGRMCYCSFGDKQGRKENSEYLKNLIDMKHGSVLEHANFTFLVTNCSRGFTHEMVRHRAGFAYSQESTHYIDYSDVNQVKVYIPPSIENGPMQDAYLSCYNAVVGQYGHVYSQLKGQKKDNCSTARALLPIGIESKLCFTGNIRALRHFMEMRGNVHNVMEIRLIAIEVFKILSEECPNLMYGIQTNTAPDGELIISSIKEKV